MTMRAVCLCAGLMLLCLSTGCEYQQLDAGKESAKDVSPDGIPRPQPPEAPPYPKATIAETEYDFGVMEAGQSGKKTFVITNDGEAPLKLVNGPTSCSCTINKLKQAELQPGQSADIKLEWTPKGETSRFGQSAEIWTNDPERKTITLIVQGRVTSAVEILPPGIWQVGTISQDKARTVKGIVLSQIYDDLKILGIDYPRDAVDVTWTPLEQNELEQRSAKSGYRIQAKILPGHDVGRFQHRLVVKTNLRGESEFPVDLTGRRTGPIVIRPVRGVRWNPADMRVSLGSFSAAEGASASLLIYVRSPGDRDFQITGWNTDPANLKDDSVVDVKLERYQPSDDGDTSTGGRKKSSGASAKPSAAASNGGNRVYRLTFTINGGQPSELRTGQNAVPIVIQTNHDKARTITFRLSFVSR